MRKAYSMDDKRQPIQSNMGVSINNVTLSYQLYEVQEIFVQRKMKEI